jgi:hypothetical protein
MDTRAEIKGTVVQLTGKEHESLATLTDKGLSFCGP